MRASVGGLVVVMMLALAGCAGGGDDGGGNSAPGSGGPCTPGGPDSKMLVGTAMDPCPQDKCCPDPNVPCEDADYVTIATCPAAMAAGGMSTWGQCQCQPKCGNGKKQPGEVCDGNDLGGVTCATMGKTGMLTCTAQCALNMAMCTTPPGMTGGNGG